MPCVLLIDDDRDTREAARDILVADGHEVRAASDGTEAILELTRGDPPAVIVVDTYMPNMDGGEFLDWLAEHPRFDPIPVVVTTGDTRIFRHPRALMLLHKPYEIDDLLAVARRFCTQRSKTPA